MFSLNFACKRKLVKFLKVNQKLDDTALLKSAYLNFLHVCCHYYIIIVRLELRALSLIFLSFYCL